MIAGLIEIDIIEAIKPVRIPVTAPYVLNRFQKILKTITGKLELAAIANANPTKNANCTNGLDNTDGIVIRANATTEAEITIHVEHLFWDSLGSELASLRFDAIAAVAGADKKVTTEEIAMQSLANLKDAQGMPLVDGNNMPIVYNPGSVPLKTQDLLSFIQASGASMAHLNGEGLCTISGL